MLNTWLSLIPPFIVLATAFVTKKINPSLALGIITASLIATNFSPTQFIWVAGVRLHDTIADTENLYMYAFLFIISIIVILISRTGGANAFANMITKHLHNATMVEASSLLISSTLFIDDYLSNLTVGYVMRSLTDRFAIPRAKLAFIVHSMSGPLVILAPVSSWVAMITGTLDQAGICIQNNKGIKILADPFFVYLQSIPYIFYSFLIIASTWLIVHAKLSFGPMQKHEITAQKTGNLFGGRNPLKDKLEKAQPKTGSLVDLFVPLIALISAVFIGSSWAGGYYLLGGERSFIEAFKHNDQIFFVLFISGIISLSLGLILAFIRNKITMATVPIIFFDGIQLMFPAILMVILASTLGNLLKIDLLTGQYLATTLIDSFSINLLPLAFFLISLITSLITGTSWGTIALMLPIAVPMLTALAQIPLPAAPESIIFLFPVLGAIFSGAVCGDHISPISETTIMASTSSGAYPFDHAHTQFLYTLPAIIGSSIGFFLTGWLIYLPKLIMLSTALGSGLASCIACLYIFQYFFSKKWDS